MSGDHLMPRTAWAETTIRRWRIVWRVIYAIYPVVGILIFGTALGVFGSRIHWSLIVGGVIAVVGQWVKRPFFEIVGCVLIALWLGGLLGAIGMAVFTSPCNESCDRTDGVGYMLVLAVPLLLICMRIVDIFTYPRPPKLDRT